MISTPKANKLPLAGESPGSAPASGWRRYRRRPFVVGLVGVLLVLLGCFSIAGAPFILILEQINAGPANNGAPFPWVLLAGQVAVSAAFVYLGFAILKGNAWGRVGFVALGGLVCLAALLLFPALWVLPGAVLYLIFAALLFQRKANYYF